MTRRHTAGRQYLVRVGVPGAQQPLVLVKQHPELTVKLGLVEQLAQHGAARSHLAALGLSKTQKKHIHRHEHHSNTGTSKEKKKGAEVC